MNRINNTDVLNINYTQNCSSVAIYEILRYNNRHQNTSVNNIDNFMKVCNLNQMRIGMNTCGLEITSQAGVESLSKYFNMMKCYVKLITVNEVKNEISISSLPLFKNDYTGMTRLKGAIVLYHTVFEEYEFGHYEAVDEVAANYTVDELLIHRTIDNFHSHYLKLRHVNYNCVNDHLIAMELQEQEQKNNELLNNDYMFAQYLQSIQQ